MDEERLHGVADARALGLGVQGDLRRDPEVGAGVDEDVAEALVVLEDGHGRPFRHHADECLPPAGHDEVDVAVESEEDLDRLPVGDVDEADGRGREPGLLEPPGEDGRDYRVRLEGVAPAPENDGVPRLDAEGSGVGGDVRPALVDEADDADRRADATDLHPVRPALHADGRAHGIGQGRDLADPQHHVRDPPLRERQPVEKGPGMALVPRPLDVHSVRLEDGDHLFLDAPRHQTEGLVLGARGGDGERASGLPGGARAPLDQLPDGHRRHGARVPRRQRRTRSSRWMTSSATR